jgi:peptidoglycan/LPS O-acetylase OafA/YrhL
MLTAARVDFWWLYVATPTRADALAAGALLAVLLRRPGGHRALRRPIAWAGGIALLSILVLNGGFDPTHHPWLRVLLYSALAVFFAALLFWSIDPQSLRGIPARFYAAAPLRVAGRYSYGLYVLHTPLAYLTMWAAGRWGLYDLTRPTWPSACALIAANAVLCATAALISFHLYEKRFLKLKRRFRPPDGGQPQCRVGPDSETIETSVRSACLGSASSSGAAR